MFDIHLYLNKLMFDSTLLDNVREHTQQAFVSERRCLHWTPANKASISGDTYACRAVLFTLNNVVRLRLMLATIEQHECLNCRPNLPCSNWYVKVDRSYNSFQFNLHFYSWSTRRILRWHKNVNVLIIFWLYCSI